MIIFLSLFLSATFCFFHANAIKNTRPQEVHVLMRGEIAQCVALGILVVPFVVGLLSNVFEATEETTQTLIGSSFLFGGFWGRWLGWINYQYEEQKITARNNLASGNYTQPQPTVNFGRTAQPQYDDFVFTAAGANNTNHGFQNERPSTGDFEFNSSRFKSEKEASMYDKWSNMANDPRAAENERMFAMRRMISADKGDVDGIKALPAPRGK